MIIKKRNEVAFEDVSAYNGVTKQIILGPKDESKEIILRYFCLEPGGNTPYHNHPFPHLVKIEAGCGVAIDKEGKEHPVEKGNYLYVKDDEVHGFKNTGEQVLEFICIVPERGEK